ncbi:DUF58 domain-containing protein [Shewanella sp. 5_MG-2023]|uniref:DUF58 domain-containing protein n=1 Tax=Shewanella sp. 5_MG-2023 TaxID=3062656 RepID=UPI0026E1DFF9|nr:DUF58 domain-containing protein [Shewanella sp. 5_MG-2023]MDO6641756.1 DUF58 domain-containing protein [Shewanella sp. 5_MG-2023]
MNNSKAAKKWYSRLIPAAIKQRWSKWLDKRIPANKQITLSHKSIFILPSGFGVAWFVLIVVLYLFGTNYQNNLVIGLSLLLASVFHSCIIYSYKNLAGLTLTALTPPETYANQNLAFPIVLSSKINKDNSQTSHQQICLNLPNERHSRITDVAEGVDTSVSCTAQSRGLANPGRIRVSSSFPLGLFNTWSYVDLNIQHIIYAAPLATHVSLTSLDNDNQTEFEHGKLQPGVDDYKGLKTFVEGESLKQVAWKQWAQGRGMLTKEFAQPEGKPVWLSLDDTLGDSLEQKLSKLAWQVNALSQSQQVFGLALNQQIIEQDSGESHRKQCQQMIALYGSVAKPAITTEPRVTPESTSAFTDKHPVGNRK